MTAFDRIRMTSQKTTPATHTFCPSLIGAILCFCGSFASTLYGQNAENFLPSATTPEVAQLKNDVEVKPVDNQPSRFAIDNLDEYIGARAAVFTMRSREIDPFGFNQDPTVKPVAKLVNNVPNRLRAARPPTPLADIVKHMHVTTIIPGEKKFLVGMRSFSNSEEFSIVFQGRKMNLKVEDVSARSIIFRNVETGEIASLQTGMLPSGMIAGSDKLKPPGMVSPLDDVPLEIGSDPPLDQEN